jgi:hypothetical protein
MVRRFATCLALGLLLSVALPGKAAAQEAGMWRAIVEVLQKINTFIIEGEYGLDKATHRINTVVSRIAYPLHIPTLLKPINLIVDEVESIVHEVGELSCGWNWSPRTKLIHDMYLNRLAICRPEFQMIWGSSEGHWNESQHELQQYIATMAQNTISDHVKGSSDWVKAFHEKEVANAIGTRNTPGEALRDAAFMLSEVGQVSQNNSDMQAARLALISAQNAHEDWEERLRERYNQDVLNGLSCFDGSCARSER